MNLLEPKCSFLSTLPPPVLREALGVGWFVLAGWPRRGVRDEKWKEGISQQRELLFQLHF